jgi:hypothetical protein
MKPFNLEEAKAGKKVVTRGGREVTQITSFNVTESKYRIVGVIDGKYLESWKEDGMSCDGEKNFSDLFMVTEKKTVWVNIYTDFLDVDKCGYFTSRAYTTESLARQESSCWVNGFDRKHIGTYPIEVEL